MPELIFITGCNAAGKSTFIRTRLNELEGFEILMTDVYKSRTKELALKAIADKKDIVLETVFNDSSFINIVEAARKVGYQTNIIVLFLDNVQQSIDRVALRIIHQEGLPISDGNVKLNFIESLKNAAFYYFYFDHSDFIYTGTGATNKYVFSFNQDKLINYQSNDLEYPQQFARLSFSKDRLDEEAYLLMTKNQSYKKELKQNIKRNRLKL